MPEACSWTFHLMTGITGSMLLEMLLTIWRSWQVFELSDDQMHHACGPGYLIYEV